jgi:uncharacterized protein (TIGR03437 family)
MFKASALRLSTPLVIVASLASAENVTVRSGNGSFGGTDSVITFLLGPPSGPFDHTFTLADFSSAHNGPAAFIVSPNPLWISGLPSDPLAQWIGTNPSAGVSSGNTALYAIPFQITSGFSSATLTINYAVDDAIGDTVIDSGPNTGVYLNGSAACSGAFAIGFNQQNSVSCGDVSSLLHVGQNWLYIEDGNVQASAGLLFSATITTTVVQPNPNGTLTVPGTAMPWLYSTTPGGLNYTYQYGLDDGTNPVIVSAANGLDFAVGRVLTITYLGGTVSVGPELGIPYTDANGLLNDTATSTGTFAPGHYMSPVAFIGELVGTFTDENGSIVGMPFALGDGPTNLTIPPGATQLQLGVDDDKYSNNVGSWSIQVSSPSKPAPPKVTSVVNAASFAPGTVAPGSIAAVFGSFPVNAPSVASSLPWPISLAGLTMQFNSGNTSLQAPMVYASGGQVNVQLPWELPVETTAAITATINGQTSPPQPFRLATFAPGIFSSNGQPAILDASYRLVDPLNPAPPGSTIQIYCTGLGAVTNQPADGAPAQSNPLSRTQTTPTVAIGGLAAQVLFSGLAPGFVGVYQLNVQLPASAPTGNAVPVALSIGGVTSNTVTLPIQPPGSLNPQPTITGLSPSAAQAGSGPMTITIKGSRFIPASSVTFDGVSHAPKFVNSDQLTIVLSASDLATAGSFPVVVSNPSPGGGSSNTAIFTVTAASNAQPSITGLSPSAAPAGSSPLTLTINGSGFISSSSVTFNGAGHSVSFVNSGQLAITLSTSDLATPGSFPVVVTNPPPSGGSSNIVQFTVTNAALVNVTGTWNGAWSSIPDPRAYGGLSATLTQNGTTVTGTITLTFSSCIPGGDVSGTISGNTLSLGLFVGPQQPMAIFLGTIDPTGNSILGAYKVYLGACTRDYGVFTAKRSN